MINYTNMEFRRQVGLWALLLLCINVVGQGTATMTITHTPGRTMIDGESKWDIKEWQRASTQTSSCFSFLDFSLYVKSNYAGDELKYKLEVTNNSNYEVDLSCSKWGFGSGGRNSVKPGATVNGSGAFSMKGERTITFSKVRFTFPKSVQDQYGISVLSDYVNCGETASTHLNKKDGEGQSNGAGPSANEDATASTEGSEEQESISRMMSGVMSQPTTKRKPSAAEVHAKHVAANNARTGSSGSSSASSSSSSSSSNSSRKSGSAGSTQAKRSPTAAEIEQQRKAEEYARKQAKLEQENRQRQEYAQWKNQQNQKNAQIAAATAVGTVSMLAILGKMIYQNMGVVNFDEVYQNQPSFSLAMEFGYSFLIQPIYFNSTVYDGVDYRYNTDYDFTWPVNFDFKLKLGYESDYFGANAYAGTGIGASIIMHSFNLPTYNYGGQIYAGLPNVKGLFEYQGGGRAFSQNYWLLEEESGDAYSSISYSQLRYGAKFTWGQFTRSHISLGLIQEGITGNDDTRVQRIELPEPYSLEDRFVTGYFFEYKKDHSYNFFLNVYPNYPFTGEVEHSLRNSSDADYSDGSLYFLVGFHRSIDAFY